MMKGRREKVTEKSSKRKILHLASTLLALRVSQETPGNFSNGEIREFN
jgi:hypothetical protein